MKLLRLTSIAVFLITVFSLNLVPKSYANVADDLNVNYNNIVDNCGTANRPAFLCSGNLIRFTSTSRNYHTWDPSPTSIRTGGVSFIFLRKDIRVSMNFEAKTSGLIYFPSMLKPTWKGRAEIICSFPADSWSGNRPSACGQNDLMSNGSQQCQNQNIYTADAWYQHFMSVSLDNYNRYKHQCGFNMAIGVQNTAAAFIENLKAINKIFDQDTNGYTPQNKYNEILIKTWPINSNNQISNPEQLPIQAFFYQVRDGNSGLADAQYFQQDYYNVTGIWIPVVKVNPENPSNITFSYSSSDQAVAGCSK